MSTPPPPPPPPSNPFGNQPPQQQYGAPPPAYSAPPGYVAYGAPGTVGAIQQSKGLSKAMIILYGLTSVLALLVGFALYQRKGAWEDFVAGEGSFSDLDAADGLVGGAIVMQFLALLASAIVTCLWAKRIATNAKIRGALNVRPGLAAGGWFIPIGWLWVGFGELRKSVNGVGGRAPSLGLWQGLFVAQAIAGFIINRFGGFSTADDAQEVSDALRNQGVIGLIGGAIYVAATIFAAKAAKEINTAVTGD